MTLPIIYQPIQVMFQAAMKGLMLPRRMGAYGTPDSPIYFEEGDTVPWWIIQRWPMNASCTFLHDIETLFEDGYQKVYPFKTVDDICRLGCIVPTQWAIVNGAPTWWFLSPRAGKRRTLRDLRLCTNLI